MSLYRYFIGCLQLHKTRGLRGNKYKSQSIDIPWRHYCALQTQQKGICLYYLGCELSFVSIVKLVRLFSPYMSLTNQCPNEGTYIEIKNLFTENIEFLIIPVSFIIMQQQILVWINYSKQKKIYNPNVTRRKVHKIIIPFIHHNFSMSVKSQKCSCSTPKEKPTYELSTTNTEDANLSGLGFCLFGFVVFYLLHCADEHSLTPMDC